MTRRRLTRTDEGPRTVEEYLAQGGVITQCPPCLPSDLMGWDTLPERILGATHDALANPVSDWYVNSGTRQAIQEESLLIERGCLEDN